MVERTNARLLAEQYKTSRNLDARVRLHRQFSTNPYPWFHWVLDQLRLPPVARILEVGGGHGLLWQENRGRIPAGWEIVVSDLSLGMVTQATGSLTGLPNICTAVVNTQALPFATGQFDAVIANHMLYHVPERSRALAEIRRVLRPDGRLFAATNDEGHMHEVRDLALEACAVLGIPGLAQIAEAISKVNTQFTFAAANAEFGQCFDRVELHLYDNRLLVTDAHALADYMLSGLPRVVARSVDEALRGWLVGYMAETGVVTITPRTGLFEATLLAT